MPLPVAETREVRLVRRLDRVERVVDRALDDGQLDHLQRRRLAEAGGVAVGALPIATSALAFHCRTMSLGSAAVAGAAGTRSAAISTRPTARRTAGEGGHGEARVD